jgi:hypothetical protein
MDVDKMTDAERVIGRFGGGRNDWVTEPRRRRPAAAGEAARPLLFWHVGGTSPAATDIPEEPRVTAPPAQDTRPPHPVDPPPADAALGLDELLEMFTTEETAAVAPSARRALRSTGARLHAWTHEWLRRATAWGAGPGGAWRAW